MKKQITTKSGKIIEMPEHFSEPIQQSKYYTWKLSELRTYVRKNIKLCLVAIYLSETEYSRFVATKDRNALVVLAVGIEHTLFFQRVMLANQLTFEYSEDHLSQL